MGFIVALQKTPKKNLYILGWTGFSVLWISLKNNALIYTGWKLLYPIPVYRAALFFQ